MRASPSEADILVIGTGAAGLSAAIALANAGFSVAAVGAIEQHGKGRTVALFEASLRFYDALGLWPRLADCAQRIETIRMVDATGARMSIPPIEFAAREIGLPAFGENIENDHLVARLAEIARDMPSLCCRKRAPRRNHRWRRSPPPSDLRIRPQHRCQTDRRRRWAKVDGARQGPHRHAGAGPIRKSALTVLTAHEKPHRGASSNFTPAAARARWCPCRRATDAPHRSSLVWLMSADDAARRRQLDDAALAG